MKLFKRTTARQIIDEAICKKQLKERIKKLEK